MGGTSMACPHVAGVAALLISRFEKMMSPGMVYNTLLDSADSVDVGLRLNASNAVSIPIALLEALASGTLAIASDIPVHQKILGNGQMGLLIRGMEPKGISDTIIAAYMTIEHSEEMRLSAQRMVVNEYSLQRMAEEYISSYLRILKAKKGVRVLP